MSARDGEEETRVDSLIDEATIASMGPGETCFELTVRSTLEVDLHPSQWEIELNGQAGAATEVAPRSSESWTSTVTRQEVVRERTTPRGTTTVTAPVEREVVNGYTVRHVRACAPTPARAGTLELRVVLPQTAGAANWGQRYAWHLRHP